ncbi:unnamed protein product [Trichobilharzia regenti]|nr:unnamed protein product [Trichobilharzia regenti]
MGQISITGLGFEWSYLSPHQSNPDSSQQQHSQLNHVVSLSSQNGSIPNSYSPTNQVAYNPPLQNNLSIDKSLAKASTISETMMMTNYTNCTLPSQSNPLNNTLTTNLSNTTTTTTTPTPTTVATSTGERNSVKGKILFNKKQVDNKNRPPIKLPLNWSVTHPAPALRVSKSI